MLEGNAEFLNNAVDTIAIKAAVSGKCNTTYLEAGRDIFNSNCAYGDYLCAIDSAGGSFRFDTIYKKNDKYHIVLRIYDVNSNIQFEDLQMGFKEGKAVIEDAFLYSITSNLSDKITSDIMIKHFITHDNPTDDARNLVTAIKLWRNGALEQMWQLLNEQKSRLQQQFTEFYRLYTLGLHACSTNFTDDLEALRIDGADERFILYHKLCYDIRTGDADAALQLIPQLITHTGDDPIYLVLYAKALINARRYEEALEIYTEAQKNMECIWDIWTGKLTCYKKLGRTADFNSCLQSGIFLYGLSDEELKDFSKNF